MNKPRVLVVEDSPVIAAMIRHFLEKCDYTIAGMAPTGEEAIVMARELKPDLALMDVELAGAMDGIQTADLIWNQFHVPVVYLTANDNQETISRAAATQAYGYLHKPVQERELSSTIQMALSKREAELRAEEHERWLRTTLSCIADAVIAADAVGCVRLVNPAAEALTGWRHEDALGCDLMDVFQVLEPGTRRMAECAVVEVIRNGGPTRAAQVRILLAKDGSEVAVEESATPIVNGAGHILGVVLVFRRVEAKLNAS